jgi:hypothetical protein
MRRRTSPETLEAWVWDMIQQALEEEITELSGRVKSERPAAVDAPPGTATGTRTRRRSRCSGTTGSA